MAEDYPRSFLELERQFSTESGCRAYLWALRWPRRIDCPRISIASRAKGGSYCRRAKGKGSHYRIGPCEAILRFHPAAQLGANSHGQDARSGPVRRGAGAVCQASSRGVAAPCTSDAWRLADTPSLGIFIIIGERDVGVATLILSEAFDVMSLGTRSLLASS